MRIKTIFMDLDGVLWRGSDPILDIPALFKQVDSLSIKVFCLTNNSTRTNEYYLAKLNRFGVTLTQDQIITSAEAAAAYLLERFPRRGSVFVVGEDGLVKTFENMGFDVIEAPGNVDLIAVVVGLDRMLTYQKIAQAAQIIRAGALFVGTNPDPTIPTPGGFAPGAGSMISAIEAAAGQKALIIGKPGKYLFNIALARSKYKPGETLMIGDRLETDIAGAQKLGIRTGLVLSGVTDRALSKNWTPSPDIIAGDALEIIRILAANET